MVDIQMITPNDNLFIFNKEIDEKLDKIIINRNKIVDNYAQILRSYRNFEYSDLNFIQGLNTEHINKINEAVKSIRHQGFYLLAFYIPFLAYNVIHTIKIYKVGLPLRKSFGVWLALILSLPVLNSLFIRRTELKFLERLEKILIDIEIDNNKISGHRKELFENQLEFYKKEKYI